MDDHLWTARECAEYLQLEEKELRRLKLSGHHERQTADGLSMCPLPTLQREHAPQARAGGWVPVPQDRAFPRRRGAVVLAATRAASTRSCGPSICGG